MAGLPHTLFSQHVDHWLAYCVNQAKCGLIEKPRWSNLQLAQCHCWDIFSKDNSAERRQACSQLVSVEIEIQWQSGKLPLNIHL